MIPQSVETVFDYIEAHPDREFVLRVSYMEVNVFLHPHSSWFAHGWAICSCVNVGSDAISGC